MVKLLSILLFSVNAFAAATDVQNVEAKIINGQYGFRNLVTNPSCKRNASTGITATAVSMTANTTSSPLDGISDCTWNPTATAQEISWALDTLPSGSVGQNCEARLNFRGDASLVSFFVKSASGNVADGISLTNANTSASQASINYPCGDGTAYSVVLRSTGDAASVQYSAYAGLATNLSNISQALLAGAGSFATTTNCQWTAALSGTFADFSTDTDCPAPTIDVSAVGSFQATDADLPQFTVNNLPPGTYQVIFQGTVGLTGGTGDTQVRISDGTTTSGQSPGPTGTDQGLISPVGYFTYTSAGNRTFKLQAAGANTLNIYNAATNKSLKFYVYKYPGPTEVALNSRLPVLPTVQTFTSGSGTYTTPKGVSYIRVRMVGAGASGGSSGTASTSAGAAGGSTTFGGYTLGGGSGGAAGTGASIGTGGVGGSASGSITGATVGVSIAGVQGGGGVTAGGGLVANTTGGYGGATQFGAGGPGAAASAGAACSGYGAGGAGGGGNTSTFPAGGGGSGPFIDFIVVNPAATYSYSVGAGGAARSAGTSGYASSAGCNAYIEVTEYYQSANAPLLVGSVTSNSTGQERIERARITISGASTCSIDSQSGSWISSVSASSSICSLTIPAGIFSGTPSCVAVSDTTGGDRSCSVGGAAAISSTGVSVQHLTAGVTGNGTCAIHCMGPR